MIKIVLIGSFVGIIGTGLGGILAVTIIKPDSNFLGITLGGASGIMLAIVTFDLLPESFKLGGTLAGIIGTVLGIVIIMFVEDIVNKFLNIGNKNNFFITGILLSIGIAMHNLPEGLAIGSGFMVTEKMGLTMALVIALHNLPEGVAMATPYRISGYPRLKVLLITIFCGLPTGIGAFIGALLGSISSFFIAICLSLAGGTMLYIICDELIPKAKALQQGRASTLGLTVGFIIGMIIIRYF